MPSYQQDIASFLHDPARRGLRARIGDIKFYLNPDSIRGDTVRNALTYVTLLGGGSFYYPVNPEEWTLQGHTGIKGAGELDRMVNGLSPTDTKPVVLLPFTFPALFLNTLYVRVDSFSRFMNNERHLYAQYEIKLCVLPRPRPPTFKRLSTSVAYAVGAAAGSIPYTPTTN
ncbi:MAG: hypothetical protein KGL39_37950 [Patescibacteria group bacterium]|nr:hypothetical protein [Patescibacteria group bacterium]